VPTKNQQDPAEQLLALLFNLGELNVENVNSSTAVAISDPATASTTVLTLNGATPVITLPAPAVGKRKRILLVQDGTGSRIPSWASASGTVTWLTGGAPTLQTAPGAIDTVTFESVDGINWLGSPGPAQPAAGSFTSITASGNATITGTLGVTGATTATSLALSGHFGANGSAAVGKSSAYTKTYSTQGRTIPVATAAGVATTGSAASTGTVYGYTTSAQADAIPVAVNALEADVLALKQLIVALVVDLQAVGIAG
jgi:hypothetical protein